MNMINQLDEWSRKHHPKWMVVLRVGLGLSLFIKGIQFIQDTPLIGKIISGSPLQNFTWLNTTIPWLHLLCGVMIIIGLFTRLTTLIQIPILIGAVIFINSKKDMVFGESDLLFTIIILILLIVFFILGGGPISWDSRLKKEKKNPTQYP